MMKNIFSKAGGSGFFGASRSPQARSLGTFVGDVPLGPPDPILGLNEAFLADTDERKINLGVGAYRTDEGKPWVLPSVREAERRLLAKDLNKEYLGIVGLPSFIKHSLKFAYGADAEILASNAVAAVQTISGTGGCRIAAEFMKKFSLSAGDVIYQPNPTWGNHVPIFKNAGMEVKTYPYYDTSANALDMAGIINTMQDAASGSAFLLHACAHNPTGMDPTHEQWEQISKLMKEKDHIAFFDCAYQGFASGDAEKDAWALRHFVEQGNHVMLAQSYAKNFGLYGERVGCFSVVCKDEEEMKKVVSQLKIIIRPMYSNPPMNGARIVNEVLDDPALAEQWRGECESMAGRIHSMRQALVDGLKEAGSTKDWSHVQQQIGMFCYSGIREDQVQRMREEFHVYMTKNGRISMAGVTSHNVGYLSKALYEVTK